MFLLLCITSCHKKKPDGLPVNTWSVNNTVNTPVGSFRTKSLPPQLIFFNADASSDAPSITFLFNTMPRSNGSYKIVQYPVAANEVSIYARPSLAAAYSSQDNSGTIYVFVNNGKVHIYGSGITLKQDVPGSGGVAICTINLSEF